MPRFSDLNKDIHDPRRYARKWGVKWELEEDGEVIASGWEEEVFFSPETAQEHAAAASEGPDVGLRYLVVEVD
jgi:hypothetical protein